MKSIVNIAVHRFILILANYFLDDYSESRDKINNPHVFFRVYYITFVNELLKKGGVYVKLPIRDCYL